MSEQNQEYLLAISLGPVQGFIAAARKTRDLWFGSKLLSDIAKATAKFIKNERGGKLIFPGIENDEDLKANSDTSVANVILAIVKGDPKEIAEQAKKTACVSWEKFANGAREKVKALPGGKNVIRDDVWNQQVNDFVEFYAAWVPYTDSNYPNQRNRVMRFLAGRKNCRDFHPETSQGGLPKSSLDGARDTVLNESLREDFRTSLHIRDGEQLDVIGVVKRFANRKNFRSLMEIAINPLLKDRQIRISEKFDLDDSEKLQKQYRVQAEKSPYLAIICADGDRMGAAISSQKTPEEHKNLSIALSGFAKSVPGIVRGHYGECVYAGGDDVLAFVPLDQVISCARSLHDDFAQKLKDYKGVSLSVGIVVGHHHEMLETLLDFARQAESIAKRPNQEKTNQEKTKDDPRYGDRNGLAIQTYHRGNSLCGVRERWQGDETSLDKRLEVWAELFRQGKISAKFPYDLRILADLYLGSSVHIEGIRADAVRSTKQKQIDPALFSNFIKIESAEDLKSLSDELLIAQMIGDAVKLAKGGKHHEHETHCNTA